jgi:proteasome lid subunit RPN8/RPN11
MRVRQAVLDVIAAHARRDSPRECCGLLIGTSADVTEAVPATNAASDPLRRWEVPAIEHLAQIKRCRELAKAGHATVGVVGAYHSHPHSAPEPSPTDREQAFEDFLYVIAGPVDRDDRFDIRAYRLRNGRFEAAVLTVVEPPERETPPAITP